MCFVLLSFLLCPYLLRSKISEIVAMAMVLLKVKIEAWPAEKELAKPVSNVLYQYGAFEIEY